MDVKSRHAAMLACCWHGGHAGLIIRHLISSLSRPHSITKYLQLMNIEWHLGSCPCCDERTEPQSCTTYAAGREGVLP